MFANLICAFACRLGGLKLSVRPIAFGAFDILQLEIYNLMDNDTAYTGWPEWVRRRVHHSIICCGVGNASLVLKLGIVLERIIEVFPLAICA